MIFHVAPMMGYTDYYFRNLMHFLYEDKVKTYEYTDSFRLYDTDVNENENLNKMFNEINNIGNTPRGNIYQDLITIPSKNMTVKEGFSALPILKTRIHKDLSNNGMGKKARIIILPIV